MKILYIAGKSNDAELAAFALQSVAPGVVVAWTASLVQARRWVDQHRQVAALIIQVEPDGPDYAAFINDINVQGVTPPVIVVAGGLAPPAPASLQHLAETTLARTPYLLNDLPAVFKRVLETPRAAVGREAPAAVAPAPAGAPPANPFAQFGQTGEALEERLTQALAEAARAAAALAEAEQRLAETKRVLERAESRHAAEMQDAAARLTDERAHAHERSAQASGALEALRSRLVDQVAALQTAEQQAAIDRQATAEETARRQAKTESELLRQTANVEALEQKIAKVETEHAAALEQLASERSEAKARLKDAQQQTEALRSRLAEAETDLQHTKERHTFELASAATRQTETEQQSEAATATLRAQLADQRAALQRAEQQRSVDRQAAIDGAAEQKAAFDAELAQTTAKHEALRSQLVDQTKKLEHKIASAEAAQTAAAARLSESQHEAEAALAALRSQLAGVTAALQRAEEQRSTDRQAAIDRAVEQKAAFDQELTRLEQELASAENAHAAAALQLTAKLTDAERQLQQAGEQHAVELAGATARLAQSQQEAAARLALSQSEAEAALAALRSQLADATAALERVESQQASDRQAAIDGAAEQQAAFDAERTQLAGKLEALRAQLADQATARQQAEQLAAMDRRALVQAAATQKTAFETEVGQLTASRDEFARQVEALRTRLAEADTKLQHATEAHNSELAGATRRLVETEQKADADLGALRLQLADATSALERAQRQAVVDRQAAIDAAAAQKAAFTAERAQSMAKHQALAQQLAHAAVQASERDARFDARLAEEGSARQAIERELVQVREESERAQKGFLDGVTEIREKAKEHARQLEERAAGERTGWETTLADRQTQIGQLEREIEAARQALAAKDFEIRRVQTAHETLRANFDRARAAADADGTKLRSESAALESQLDDHVRRFDTAPVSICRIAADGTITHASRRLAKLLGYASPEDLQKVSLAAIVFRSADELHWLIDRCRSSRSAQSIETTWAKKDGSRIIVRLVAAPASDGGIDLAADDITSVKALEEKLNHAQRLEAVARYASEVAVSCGNLLEDVKRNVEEWLPNIDSQTIRHQGEQLVADVSRASGLLRQVTLYGDKQKQVAPLVAVNNVLQDLASVLKRVAGENIALVLPKDSKPLNLDVDAEQAERIFVNVAAYARQRMPFGGRLLIESTPAIVDREFAEKYRNVRPGAHVLFTVTEQKSPSASTPAAPGLTAPRTHEGPGLDLGVLQSLVGDCGGHLWMAAEPTGDMVLKIHLPRRPLDDPEAAKVRGRWISRLVAATASRQLN